MKKRADYRAVGAGILETIGEQARETRERLGYSYRDVQRLYGIPASTAHAFERGRVDSVIIARTYDMMSAYPDPGAVKASMDTRAFIPEDVNISEIADEVVDHIRATTTPIGVVDDGDGAHLLPYPAGAENVILSVRVIAGAYQLTRYDGEDYSIGDTVLLRRAVVEALRYYYKEQTNGVYGLQADGFTADFADNDQ